MNSPTLTTTTSSSSLPAQLEQIGLHALASQVDDFLARAAKQRWSPRQILEHLAQTEAAERAHRSLERRLRLSEIEEERRLCYVGMTRACQRLILTRAEVRQTWVRVESQKASRFLEEVPAHLVEDLCPRLPLPNDVVTPPSRGLAVPFRSEGPRRESGPPLPVLRA